MSDFLHNMHEQHKERREERREAHHERRAHGGGHDEYGSQRRGYDDEPQSYSQDRYQGQGRAQVGGYAPPSGPPPSVRGGGYGDERSGFGGLDRGDFANDVDIDRMVASGTFDGDQGRRGGYAGEYGNDRAGGRYDSPSGPLPGQGHGRYDAPSGPPPGRGRQDQESGYGSGGYASGYGGGPDQYTSSQTGRSQYETSQGPQGRSHGNAPSGGFTASRDGEESYGSGYGGRSGDRDEEDRYGSGYGGRPGDRDEPPRRGESGRYEQQGGPGGGFGASRDEGDQYGSGYGGRPGDRDEPPRRGEAASYYGQQGQGDRYGHLAGLAREHGNGDPEVYRQATQGLHERIQSQAETRRPGRNDEDDYRAHADAHRKAYGDEDNGPMDTDTIGAAAAMEAFKQTAAGAGGKSNAPAGGFQAGKPSGGPSSKLARDEEEETETEARASGSGGGMQDKLMALAMSHAGKLFDKKNAGSSGDKSQDKAQAMQSAAASAMQLFSQYQSKGKLESGDMSKVIGLAMNLM